MAGSVKGRVIGHASLRTVIRKGVCAWCGEDCFAPTTQCPRCWSEEIDWRPAAPPPAPAPDLDPTPAEKHQHFASTHQPGSIAYSLLGGFVRGRSAG